MSVLMDNDWKGNIRELANFVERAVILTRGEELEYPYCASYLPHRTSFCRLKFDSERCGSGVIAEALRATSGRIAGKGGAAERLGLKRTTLQNKMRRLSIARSDYSTNAIG